MRESAFECPRYKSEGIIISLKQPILWSKRDPVNVIAEANYRDQNACEMHYYNYCVANF